MTREQFDLQMARMAGLRFMPGDTDTHWEALADLPDAVLEAAVTRAQRTRTDFPTPFELRQDADAVAHLIEQEPDTRERSIELPAPVEFAVPHVDHPLRVTREWRYDCEVCSDGGMRSFWCGEGRRQPWLYLENCERRGVHGGHEWTRRCECYDTNPSVQRRLASQAKYAASGAQKRTAA